MNQSTDGTYTSQSDEDLNARARIRQAALVEFARHGFKGASIRGIAKAAGVSPGLVQHHFGTKDGLRESCDAYVMEFLTETQNQVTRRGAPPAPGLISDSLRDMQPIIDYLVMSLSSGSDTADKWFNDIAEYTHEALMSGRVGPPLDPDLDTRAIAATQTAMALGITAFYGNIQRALGIEDQSELITRVGRARLFLASDRILGEETRDRLAQALNEYERSKTTGKPPPASNGDEPD